MSNYINFTRAFPKKCADLLRVHHPAKWTSRQVTLLLTVASAGLTFPTDRFEHRDQHAPFNEWERFPKAQVKYIRLMVEKFFGSILLPDPPRSWNYGSLTSTADDPQTWNELQQHGTPPVEMTIYDLLKHLRRSFSQGYVYTQDAPISRIIFVAVNRNTPPRSEALTVSPDDLHEFLGKWFEFLDTLEFSKQGVPS